MLQKTKGIVIKTFRYGESSLIAKIFTRDYGFQSFFLPAIKSRKKDKQTALYQGMNLLDLVIYQKEGKQLNHIKEAKISTLFHSIPADIVKTSLLFFLNELLYHSIPEERNPMLFQFVENQLYMLEKASRNLEMFHHRFMLEYARHLGIIPLDNYTPEIPFFHIETGRFYPVERGGGISREDSLLIHRLLSDQKEYEFSRYEREVLLSVLLDFYQTHIPGFPELKSNTILKTILHG
jgi:DNA repair protein RecO (recombination protein O)